IIAVVEVSSSLLSNWTFSVFFAFEIAMSSLRYDIDQLSVISCQFFQPTRSQPLIPAPSPSPGYYFKSCSQHLRAGHDASLSSNWQLKTDH
ncbi:MAG: hypothetical protein WBQ94_05690, partial [Terracidiphilus sp.]